MADNSSTKVRSCDKKCSNCGTKQPVARRKCVNCSSSFPKVKKDLEKLKGKKMTNITQQRKLMESRADILHMHHSCDIIIMMHHKHGNGDTLTFYGTEGAGVSFIGNKADIKASEGGKMALMLFRKFMEDLKSKNKRKPATQDPSEGSHSSETTTSQPTLLNSQPIPSISPEVLHNPVSSSATPPSQPIIVSSSAAPPPRSSTVLSSTALPAQPNSTVLSSTVPLLQPSIVSSAAAPPPKPSTVSSSATLPVQPNSAVSSAAPPAQPNSTVSSLTVAPLQPSIGADAGDIVAYQVGDRVLACGQVQRGRNNIHGCSIPSSHVCVLITKTLQNVAAPLILGDISENSYLTNGQFFALPLLHLKTARLTSNSSLELRPFI